MIDSLVTFFGILSLLYILTRIGMGVLQAHSEQKEGERNQHQ